MAREKKVEQYDVVIIGGGAGGLTAGIYCGRAQLKTIIIEKALVGGLATYTNEIENYPGFPEGSTGLGLMELFQKQAKKFGVDFKLTDVKTVDLKGEVKVVETFRNRYEAKVVIIATGGRPRVTNAQDEEKYLFDKGISFCATCDAAANTGKDVMVIGSGDAAIEEGMFLTKFAKKVYVSVMHDTGKMDCNEIARDEALKNEKMEFLWNTVVERFEGEDHLERVVLKNLKTGNEEPVTVDTCFEFIGYLPNSELLEGQVNITEKGYVEVNERMETNVEGVFSVGDINDKFLKQVATAVGDGAIAGYGAEKYIAETEVFHSQVMRHDMPVAAFVFDASCSNCREKLPVMEYVEKESNGRYKVVKIDVYKSRGLADRLKIQKFPTVAIIKDGQIETIIEDKNITESSVLSKLLA
jgi:thioredoxin reductase (NADPH)